MFQWMVVCHIKLLLALLSIMNACCSLYVCVSASCLIYCGWANALFNSSMKGHVEGSICLLMSGTRALVIKMLVDLNWGTMETRGKKRVCVCEGI